MLIALKVFARSKVFAIAAILLGLFTR